MAICRSHIFSAMAGSVNGITYLRNRYCAIVARNRTTPTDPATAAQAVVRARFAAAMSAWQALTQLQRDVWDGFAKGTPWENHLGDPCTLTGLGMYLSIRLAALQIVPALPTQWLDDPPCTPGLFPRQRITIGYCTAGIGQIGFKVNFYNDHPTKTVRFGVHMSLPQNTTINFWKGPYDVSSYYATGNIGPGASFSYNFTRLQSGKRYFMKFRVINMTDQDNVSTPWYRYRDAVGCIS